MVLNGSCKLPGFASLPIGETYKLVAKLPTEKTIKIIIKSDNLRGPVAGVYL